MYTKYSPPSYTGDKKTCNKNIISHLQGSNVFHERILEKYLVMKKYMRNFAAEMGRAPHNPAPSIVMEKGAENKRQLRF